MLRLVLRLSCYTVFVFVQPIVKVPLVLTLSALSPTFFLQISPQFLFPPILRTPLLFLGPELPAEALPRTSEGGEFSHVRRGGAHIRQHPGNRPVSAPVSTQPYRGYRSGQSVSGRVRLQELSGERIIEILILFFVQSFYFGSSFDFMALSVYLVRGCIMQLIMKHV